MVSRLLALERRGLVETAVDPDDRRGRRLILTRVGHRTLQSALPIWKRTHAQADRLLTQTDAEILRAGLRALS